MKMPIAPEAIVDKLYDIALDPSALESFIDVWTEAGLDTAKAQATAEAIQRFDETYRAHLLRAKEFLERGDPVHDGHALMAVLEPFENLAAFILDEDMTITLCNTSAQKAYALSDGMRLDQGSLPTQAMAALKAALTDATARSGSGQSIVKTQLGASESPLVMQIRQIPPVPPETRNLSLVVTTSYHWNETLGPVLGEIFDLTQAEQSVVRLLVKGLNVRETAQERDTSEGTVRAQLKSILKKMNARSQSEVIRLVVHLQSVSRNRAETGAPQPVPREIGPNWLDAEVWAPFKSITLADGRRLEYHEMGPANGAPVLYSHMGYCMVRWHAPMLRCAYTEGLRVICPIRAGYGQSDNLDPSADVLVKTRDDTLALMDHLNLSRVPYVVQGNDLVFAMDLAAKHPERVSEIIGLGARPYMHGDLQYAGMSKWHRFFISTAKHSPHLLRFTARAWISLMRRVGGEAMFRNAHKASAADMNMDGNQPLIDVMVANSELVAGKTADASQAYTMELILTESPWDNIILEARGTKTWFLCGSDDPLMDVSAIAGYRDAYPWIDIEVIQNGGQMLIYQHFETILPRIAQAARNAKSEVV